MPMTGRMLGCLIIVCPCCLTATSAIADAGADSLREFLAPPRTELSMPLDGFGAPDGRDVDPICEDEQMDDRCPEVADSLWTRCTGDSANLFVFADGPNGSGRYWCLTAGIGSPDSRSPMRGVCLLTTTIGWRTLAEYQGGLRWAADLRPGGAPELILWDSFPLNHEASNAEYGLIAWVYGLSADGMFTLDWDLSRGMARNLASRYRTPLSDPWGPSQAIRDEVARALDWLAATVDPLPARQ